MKYKYLKAVAVFIAFSFGTVSFADEDQSTTDQLLGASAAWTGASSTPIDNEQMFVPGKIAE
jgi:hypothetical protein